MRSPTIPTIADVTAVIAEPRTKFVVPYTISGKKEVVASSQREAELKFAQFDVKDLAEDGELQSFEPERAVR